MNGLMDSLGIAASSLGKVHFRQNPHQMDSFMYPGETVTIPLPPELTQLLNKQKSEFPNSPASRDLSPAAHRGKQDHATWDKHNADREGSNTIFWLSPL